MKLHFRYTRGFATHTFLAIFLYIMHFTAHYVVVSRQYVMYLKLLESGDKATLEKYVRTVGRFTINIFTSYPEPQIYFPIIIVSGISIILISYLLKYMLSLISKDSDKTDITSLLASYCIAYFIVVISITKPMMNHWADYGLLGVNVLLILITYMTTNLITRIKKLLLSQRTVSKENIQHFIGRITNYFIQGFLMLFPISFIYILFYGYTSYPTEVKKYGEYFQCVAVGIIVSIIYAAIVLYNVYRLLKLEYEVLKS